MKKVVIGGSRAIAYLSQPVKTLLDSLIQNNDVIMVGDANGADKATQRYLYTKSYKNVTVYCMFNACRNNIGQWPVRNIVTSNRTKNADYFGTKDLHMARESDFGIMIWDGESKGTFRNVINLLDDNKCVYVYYHPSKRISLVASMKDFDNLVRTNTSKNALIFKTELKKRLQSLKVTPVSKLIIPEKACIQGTLFKDYVLE